MVAGINHITLSIKNVAESFDFYCNVLELRPVARWPKGAYLLAGEVWIALVLDTQTRAAALPEYTHIAFTVSPAAFHRLGQKILAAQAPIWQENQTEGDSIYFIDPNGHKLEIHASDLAERLRSAKEDPWDGLEFFDLPETGRQT